MPAITPAYVKNIIRRCFSEIVDPSPTKREVDAIWQHFDNCCAYCGKSLQRKVKEGHIDHLVSASRGGMNALGNRVLSCSSCNEMEKLDKPWEDFLKSKARSDADFMKRYKRIKDWQAANPLPEGAAIQEDLVFARTQATNVIATFEEAVRKTIKKRPSG
ncbi:MAG: HNH endonuclease [Planctomycetes bacterium]|nr:HNH endonuclease [Planctomycetota bacterium]